MPALALTPAQRRELRAEAHHLDPVVMIGGDGLTPAVEREADAALKAHGLIKVRALGDDREARAAQWLALADRLGAAPVQHIGKLLVLWRPKPDIEKAVDPDRKPGPKLVKIVKPSKSPSHRPTIKKVRLAGNMRVTAGGLVKRKDAKRAAAKSSKKRAQI
jgi:putative YhbY family RNA-binding protein